MRLFDRTSLPADARRILAPYVPAGGTVALSRSVHLGRYVALLIDDSGSPTAIAKIATDDLGRARLRTERLAVDERAALLRPPLRGPTVVAADDDVLILEWVAARSRRRPWLLPAEVAHGLGDFFARGMFEEAATIRGPAHGDTAPWNLLRCGDEWLLVDWEVSLADAPPFFDVYHYIVQSHSHLGRPRRGELLRGVAGEGWIGEAIAAYAEGAGLSIAAAGPAFERYLEHTSTPGTMRDMAATGVRLRRELRWEVGG